MPPCYHAFRPWFHEQHLKATGAVHPSRITGFRNSKPMVSHKMSNVAAACMNVCLNFTAGGSQLGQLNSPTFPRFIDGPHPGGSPNPWGDRTASNCNPYDVNNVPNTGVTRHYDWTVTNTTLAPDGVPLPLLVVNGQFPGPGIEANWGDWIVVNVKNSLPAEGKPLSRNATVSPKFL